jgi:hypothetical protein
LIPVENGGYLGIKESDSLILPVLDNHLSLD